MRPLLAHSLNLWTGNCCRRGAAVLQCCSLCPHCFCRGETWLNLINICFLKNFVFGMWNLVISCCYCAHLPATPTNDHDPIAAGATCSEAAEKIKQNWDHGKNWVPQIGRLFQSVIGLFLFFFLAFSWLLLLWIRGENLIKYLTNIRHFLLAISCSMTLPFSWPK